MTEKEKPYRPPPPPEVQHCPNCDEETLVKDKDGVWRCEVCGYNEVQ